MKKTVVELARTWETRARGLREAGSPPAEGTEREFGDWLRVAAPGLCWEWPHLRLLVGALDELARGEIDRLMVFMPPRHGKSECATIHYPAYRLERDPNLRVILGAYNQPLAERFSRRVRRLARERSQEMEPEAGRGKGSRAGLGEVARAWEWETPAGGGMRAAGVGSGITGLGANLIVIDDPVKSREEAESRAYRERVWEWYTDDLYTRQEPGCGMVLIQTRWHEDDLAGRILRSEEGLRWTVVRLPALAETQEERDAWARRCGRPLGEPEPVGREPGEPLCPERYDAAALARIRQVQGRSFAALFQQNPVPAEGGLFRREWFKLVDVGPAGVPRVRFWDCAAKAGQRNDYTVGALLARTGKGEWFLMDMVRGRWEYPDAKRKILETAERDGKEVPIGIEESANGTALLQDLRRDAKGAAFTWKAVRASADKAVRAGAWASAAEGGLFHLVRGGWNGAFLEEAELFPLGAHDDQVDAVSGAYALALQTPRPGDVPVFHEFDEPLYIDYPDGRRPFVPMHRLRW